MPDHFVAHANLGSFYWMAGRLDEAIAECRTALRLKPDFAPAHDNLGIALAGKGQIDEAIAEFQAAIRIYSGDAGSYLNLGNALLLSGRLDEGIAQYRISIGLKPDQADAHKNLGIALRSRGEFTAAIAELRKSRDLARTNAPLYQEVERELKATERQASLAARLPAVLAGQTNAADAVEMLGFAQLCYERKLHGASARFWVEAFQAQPKLADDMQVQNRYNAACAAVLAGCGQGKDEPPLDEAARTRWRKQAIHWLSADLVFWSKQLKKGPPQVHQFAAQTFQHWKADPDLAGIREQAALAKLPSEEQKACQSLWVEVDALLRRAQTGQAQQVGPPVRELPANVFAS
jgi:tetratricopeptide (TPR) repeat protein